MRFYTMLLESGFTKPQLRGKSPKQLEKMYINYQRAQAETRVPTPPRPPKTSAAARIRKQIFAEQNRIRYRKANKDYDANKPEYQRGMGDKYCQTFKRDKVSGDITRGAAVANLP